MKKYNVNNKKVHLNKNTSKNNVNQKKLLEQQQKEREAKLRIEEENNKIVANTQLIIDQLNHDAKKWWLFKKKKEAKKIANELQLLIDEKQYDDLKNKLEILNKLNLEDKKELEEEKEEKEKKVRRSFSEFLKTTRYPIVTRVIKIVKNETGRNRTLKLLGLSGIIILLLGISVIGFLLYFGVISEQLTGDTTNNIIFAVIFSLPLAALFMI